MEPGLDEWTESLFDDIGSEQSSTEGAEEASERKQESEKQEVKPEPPKQQPQVLSEEITILRSQVEDAKEIASIFKRMQAKDADPEALAIDFVAVMNRRPDEAKKEAREAKEAVYFSSPEGQAVKHLMDKYPGISKDVAALQAKDMMQFHTESRQKSPIEAEFGISLSPRDKMTLQAWKVTPKEYFEDLKSAERGFGVAYNENGEIEMIGNVPMTRGDLV